MTETTHADMIDRTRPTTTELPYVVAALYKFTHLEALEDLRASLLEAAAAAETCGSLLIAPEGINGTIAGNRAGIDAMLDAIRAIPGCADIEHKESFAEDKPFARMKVRIKREIVTMGVPGLNPDDGVGTYVSPQDWNALITSPGVVLVDARNDYEVAIGSFEGAIDPQTAVFGELPAWMDDNLDPERTPRVAMFCTGGIRCEKSTAYLKQRGFREVYHLQGGILKYLEEVPQAESLWRGACFVFDERVAVGHGLSFGSHAMCRACGRAVAADAPTEPCGPDCGT